MCDDYDDTRWAIRQFVKIPHVLQYTLIYWLTLSYALSYLTTFMHSATSDGTCATNPPFGSRCPPQFEETPRRPFRDSEGRAPFTFATSRARPHGSTRSRYPYVPSPDDTDLAQSCSEATLRWDTAAGPIEIRIRRVGKKSEFSWPPEWDFHVTGDLSGGFATWRSKFSDALEAYDAWRLAQVRPPAAENPATFGAAPKPFGAAPPKRTNPVFAVPEVPPPKKKKKKKKKEPATAVPERTSHHVATGFDAPGEDWFGGGVIIGGKYLRKKEILAEHRALFPDEFGEDREKIQTMLRRYRKTSQQPEPATTTAEKGKWLSVNHDPCWDPPETKPRVLLSGVPTSRTVLLKDGTVATPFATASSESTPTPVEELKRAMWENNSVDDDVDPRYVTRRYSA